MNLKDHECQIVYSISSRRKCLPVEDVIDLLTNESTQSKEFSVDAMENRLQKVTFAWILWIEEIQNSQHELTVDVTLCNVRLKVGRFEKAQEQLVYNLKMRPRWLKRRLVFLWIKLGPIWVRRWWQSSEKINCKLWRIKFWISWNIRLTHQLSSPSESLQGKQLQWWCRCCCWCTRPSPEGHFV